MKNEIYRETLLSASDSACGEPVLLCVTEEVNGHAVFVWDDYNGPQLVQWVMAGRDNAIRWAVLNAKESDAVQTVIGDNKKGGAK